MTKIKVKILKDSVSPSGNRLTSFEIAYPRFILAEINTHRMLSKNSASSRAIPLKAMLEAVTRSPVMPLEWQKNQAGMQGIPVTEKALVDRSDGLWIDARDRAISTVEEYAELNVHKQIPNRILEPWFHTTTVITGTDWANFFHLRNHPDAAPTIQALAKAMQTEYEKSNPILLEPGFWHAPYTDKPIFWNGLGEMPDDLKVSVARCARVSYNSRDGLPSKRSADIALYDRLVVQKPAHASPTEHQATPVDPWEYAVKSFFLNYLTGRDYYLANFNGWKQLRKGIEGENKEQEKML